MISEIATNQVLIFFKSVLSQKSLITRARDRNFCLTRARLIRVAGYGGKWCARARLPREAKSKNRSGFFMLIFPDFWFSRVSKCLKRRLVTRARCPPTLHYVLATITKFRKIKFSRARGAPSRAKNHDFFWRISIFSASIIFSRARRARVKILFFESSNMLLPWIHFGPGCNINW